MSRGIILYQSDSLGAVNLTNIRLPLNCSGVLGPCSCGGEWCFPIMVSIQQSRQVLQDSQETFLFFMIKTTAVKHHPPHHLHERGQRTPVQ